jgi:hypothetical protein
MNKWGKLVLLLSTLASLLVAAGPRASGANGPLEARIGAAAPVNTSGIAKKGGWHRGCSLEHGEATRCQRFFG